jgi:uncharacterized protein
MLSPFVEIQSRLAAHTDLRFKRYLYNTIDWETRLFAVIGPRGIGKTTMLLQHYREVYNNPAACLYVSADNIKAQAVGLYEIAGEFFRCGGKLLLLDEVHRYPNWTAEVKSIYDSWPTGRVGLSGSSMLGMLSGGADLSRRLVTYRMQGLSFREYLALSQRMDIAAVSLDQLLENHTTIAADSLAVAGGTIVNHFRQYLTHGIYPFFVESEVLYQSRLENVIEKVLSDDIPSVTGIRPESIPVLRRLVFMVASAQPFVPNIERMATVLGVSRETIYRYLQELAQAGLFSLLAAPGAGMKAVRKPAKVLLENPNLFPAILGSSGLEGRIGAMRESFFHHQISLVAKLTSDNKLDFRTRDGTGFEIGGRSKSEKQLANDPQAWLAVDDTEIGSGRRVPLWLFGLLY